MMRVGGKAAYESDENKKAGKKLVDAKSRGSHFYFPLTNLIKSLLPKIEKISGKNNI
jgi:hypothetical protein